MKNPDIAGLFEAIADRLEVLGENAFRINSYRKASRVVAELTDDIAAVAEAALEGTLPELVSLDDIRGDLQMHSTHSDGSASVSPHGPGASRRDRSGCGTAQEAVARGAAMW